MKNVLKKLLLPLVLCGIMTAQSQSECDLYVNADFDSECLLTEYIKARPSLWEQGLEDCMQACKGNIVSYTAVCPNGIQYSWTISGAASYQLTNQNRTAVVTWGSGDVGNISVNVVTADSNTCTAETCVLLMESPHIASSTVPAYYIDQHGNKVIEMCWGETLELMDMSTAGQTPIVGYLWETPFGDASTPNHTIAVNQTGDHVIRHLVQNECGCEGFEEIIVRVLKPSKLVLSCYGTVCAGSEATYTLLNPNCSQYMWSVDGGTYTTNPSTPATINVQWGSPASGYGVISIDESFCNSPCKALSSIKIPVISDNTSISGPSVVCVGDVQQYELPVWGSTQYYWNVSPTGGTDTYNTEELNQVLVEFFQTGTYTLYATYECNFLNCGPFSTQKTIVVKDTMSIKSVDNTLCKGDTGTYTTWHGNSVIWRVYNQNNAQIYYTNGVALNYTFANAGRYKIVASNSNYCDDAEYLVTVLDNPPAPTLVNGPNEACQYSAILLSGTPSHPNYYLEWEPLCTPSIPQSGDEVTISYGDEVCDVAVYQIDAENGCRSTAYIHEVDTFRLAPHGIPALTVACAGSTVHFSVPTQANVTYEWTITPANAASVISDHLQSSVDILTNHLSNVTPPYLVDVTLKRTYCDNQEVYETVQIQIEDVLPPTLQCPDITCQYEPTTFAAVGGTSVANHYTWQFSDTSLLFHGAVINREFTTSGLVSYTLTYQPNPNCDPAVVHGQIYVQTAPVVAITRSGNVLSATYQPGLSYEWTHNGNIVGTGPTYSDANLNGTYCCMVFTSTTPSCTTLVCYTIPIVQPDTCLLLETLQSTLQCDHISIEAINPLGLQLSWSISTGTYGSYCYPPQSMDLTTAYFAVPGEHYVYVYAEDGGQCYKGIETVTVDCIPRFELSYDCNGNIIVTDKSLYRSGYAIPARTYSIAGVGSVTLTAPTMSGNIHIGNPSNAPYTVTMTMDGSTCTCSESITLEPNPVITGLDVPSHMCEKTPFLFSANVIGSNLQYRWDFGDGSTNEGNNIYHSYDNSSVSYSVTLNVENSFGCVSTMTQSITVGANVIYEGLLDKLTTIPVCPGLPRTIHFLPHTAFNSLYYWDFSTVSTTSYTYNTYHTGDYRVLAYTTNYGCKKEAMLNVRFLNAPTARITGNTTYCFGEEVKLNGNTGSHNTYAWTITGPESHTFNTANITFTPALAGTYNVVLDVTSSDGCTETATCTVTVHPQPAAPPIAFYNNECIHTPPVYVHSTASPAQNLLWSNGFHGVSAQYYVPGYLTAHYIEPTTGCPSAKSTLFIPPAPNYDALLTGCYKLCKEELPTTLPVYNFYPYHSGTFYWNWYYNSSWLAGGSTLYANLPINNFGYYYLNTQYGNGCTAQSPSLEISAADVCPCDSITIDVKKDCDSKECKLLYNMSVTICNHGSQWVHFNQLYTNASSVILSASPTTVSIAPGGCQTVSVVLEFRDFANPYVEFTLYDSERNCEKKFTEYFDWKKCIDKDCDAEIAKMSFNPGLSSPHQVSYFDFDINFPFGINSVVSIWSNPPQIHNHTDFPPTNVIGLLMLNYAQLTQMMQTGEKICIYAIVCTKDNTLCYVELCFDPKSFYEQIPEQYRKIPDSATSDTDSTKSLQSNINVPESVKPYLAPNPAHNEVTVMGIAPENVSEITVLTMQGGQVADYRNDYRFNVANLARASYIVRVITKDNTVHYLKLVKQ